MTVQQIIPKTPVKQDVTGNALQGYSSTYSNPAMRQALEKAFGKAVPKPKK